MKENHVAWDVFLFVLGAFLFVYEGCILPFAIAVDWLVIALAAFGVLCMVYAGYEWKTKTSLLARLPKWLHRSIQVVIVLCVTLFVALEALIVMQNVKPIEKDSKYVLVLGALVKGDTISKSLEYRLEAALELYEQNEKYLFVVSGGKGPEENNTEAYYMRKYLMEHGIPESQIIVEDNSFNTYENMLYTKEILDKKEKNPYAVIVVSNGFHLYRSQFLAKSVGFQKVSTYPAKQHGISTIHYYIRESLALGKDLLFHS